MATTHINLRRSGGDLTFVALGGGAGEHAAAAVTAATGAATTATAMAELARARADDIPAFAGFRDAADLTTLLANSTWRYDATGAAQVVAGDVFRTRKEGFSYQAAASGASDHHLTTAGGLKFYADVGAGGVDLAALGIPNDGSDQNAAIQSAIDRLHSLHLLTGNKYRLYVTDGVYGFTNLVNKTGVILSGRGGVLRFMDGIAVNADTNYYPINDIGYSGAGFEHLVIDGNSANNPTSRVCDMLTITGDYSFALNIEIINAVDSGVMFSNAAGSWIDLITVRGSRDVGVYVNNNEGSENSIGGMIGRVWAYDCRYSGVSFKRSSSGINAAYIYAERCGNILAFEDFGVGDGGAPAQITVGAVEGYDIGYMHREFGAAESGLTINAAASIYIGSFLGRRVSGPGVVMGAAADVTIGRFDATGYPTDPRPSGLRNTAVQLDQREGVPSKRVRILSGRVADFAYRGVWLANCEDCEVTLDADVSGTALQISPDAKRNTIRGRYEGENAVTFEVGAEQNNISGAYFPDLATDIERRGGRRSTAIIDPRGAITPRYDGEKFLITTGNRMFEAVGPTSADWRAMGAKMKSATLAEFQSATSAINTQGKEPFEPAWETTTPRILVPIGGTATSQWRTTDGATIITPA